MPITDANKNVTLLVGQFVNLWAKVMPDGEPGTYLWKNPPANTFYDYKFDANTATLTKLPKDGDPDPNGLLTNKVLWFYWTDAADNRKVVCTFTPKVGKEVTNLDTSLNVKSPKVSEFKSTIGKAGFWTDPAKVYWFGLFDADGAGTGKPGIRWKATVDSIKADFGAEGQWQFVQRVYKDMTYKDDQNKTYTWKPAKEFLLDTDSSQLVPYDGTYDTGSGSQGPASIDTPKSNLVATDRLLTATRKFELYAMFLPPPTSGGNSRWVPLQVLNWSFQGTCTWNGTSWDLTGNDQSPNQQGAATTAHPVWTSNSYKGTWVADQ